MYSLPKSLPNLPLIEMVLKFILARSFANTTWSDAMAAVPGVLRFVALLFVPLPLGDFLVVAFTFPIRLFPVIL
jgi:hypothetical protein